MVVDVDLRVTPATVRLAEADDFARFKVVARGAGGDGELASAVERVARLSQDGHAFVRVDAVRELAGERAGDAAWSASFDDMVEYARGRGWTDDAGAIRAHVEWTG